MNMNKGFPIPTPERLPKRINPCPIVEAIFEVRFVTSEPWRTLPGLLFGEIRDKYSEQKDLPLARFPDEFRRQEPGLTYLPLVQFLSSGFLVQLGPRMVSLVTKSNSYPGWSSIKNELAWLLQRVGQADFVEEGERLSIRYIDFFEKNIFEKLIMQTTVLGKKLDSELQVTAVLTREPFKARLSLTNGAILSTGDNAKVGSVLDLDLWLGPLGFDLFSSGMNKFEEAHSVVKEVFFGLLTQEALTEFNPEYS